jgi:hypothetical protein
MRSSGIMAVFWTTSFVFWANDAGAAQKANAATTGNNNEGILFMAGK